MTSSLLHRTAKQFVERLGIRSFRHYRQNPLGNFQISGYDGKWKLRNMKMAVVNCANYSEYSKPNLSWKRPEGPLRVWREFEGSKKSADGTIPRFSIQDIPEEMVEDVLDFMLKYILAEEAFSLTLGLAKDPPAIEDLRNFWRKMMRQGMSIVVLAANSDPSAKPVIVGANILTVLTAQDKTSSRSLEQFRTRRVKTFFGLVFDVEDKIDVLSKYGVDKYLGSVGLVAHPAFRGHGLGAKILKVREDIGRAYQIPVTEAMFTTKASQISASRAGFELQLVMEYSELLDYEGKLVFPGMTGKFVRVMTKKLYQP